MPAWKQASATAATTAPGSDGDAERVGPTTLLGMTCLGAFDGTIVLLAASGAMSTMAGAILTGLTVVAGIGAWIVARQAFPARGRTWRDRAVLAIVALATSLATVAAAWLGDMVGGAVTLHVLPRAAGLILLAVAVEVGGWRLPRVRGIPLPFALIGAAGILEGVAQWTQ